MLKLLLWRLSVIQKPPLNPIIFSHLPSSLFLFTARFRSHSPAEENYDPPFSPTHSGTQKERNKSKIIKKKNTLPKVPNKSDEHPVKSELPFDFMYSYSEISTDVEPIGFREPRSFSPFGPGRIDRTWTGTRAPVQRKHDSQCLAEERERVIGEPLSDKEIAELVDKYRHNDCARQINLGKGGVTHNTLVDIHNHWKRAEAVRIKCLGVPTLDMDNICFHLEDKTGGKIIYRRINILLLYRGRNYDPSKKPDIPMMLWKPHSPIFPKLVKSVADGLTFEETKEKRNIGLNSPPLMKLSRNGVYVNVVERVRTAFETEEIVRLDCAHVGKSDCKKIGVKLRDLVPCVPLLFKDEQIIIWRGNKEPG